MEKGINVLSLFDGISCGQIALDRAGKLVNKYLASEIKGSAIKVALDNFPNTIEVGDITKLRYKDNILYSDGVIVFMKKDSQEQITKYLFNIEPIDLNSNLVSAQNRRRLYWTNIKFDIPEDRKLLLKDVIEYNYSSMVDCEVHRTPSRAIMWGNGVNGKCKNITHSDKASCITTKMDRWNNAGLLKFGNWCRFLTPLECERLQTLPEGYTEILTKNQRYDVIGDGWTVDIISHIFKNLN